MTGHAWHLEPRPTPGVPSPPTPLPRHGPAAPTTIRLSLVSHTNVGKTTLARTLLGRDIGEVRDEAHVTQLVERHT